MAFGRVGERAVAPGSFGCDGADASFTVGAPGAAGAPLGRNWIVGAAAGRGAAGAGALETAAALGAAGVGGFTTAGALGAGGALNAGAGGAAAAGASGAAVTGGAAGGASAAFKVTRTVSFLGGALGAGMDGVGGWF